MSNYHNLSTSELLREAELSDDPLVKVLAEHIENNSEETINGKTDDDYINACVSHLEDVSGEDFHTAIIEQIRKLEHIKKIENWKGHITIIVKQLEDMDYRAMSLTSAIKADGVIL